MVGHGLGKICMKNLKFQIMEKRERNEIEKRIGYCIEPMINMGKRQIRQENDGWTIRTADGKPSAHFEHSNSS